VTWDDIPLDDMPVGEPCRLVDGKPAAATSTTEADAPFDAQDAVTLASRQAEPVQAGADDPRATDAREGAP
jgi:hypothetical protein